MNALSWAPGSASCCETAVAEERLRNARTGTYDITVTGGDGRTVALFRGNSYQIKGETVPGLGAGPEVAEET